MIMSGIYAILALLGLGFLIFIHELGHYIMARRVGMKIEVFSIGFGKPLFSWMFQGVKWQLCCLPFGGYVKIFGDQQKDCPDGQQPDPTTFYGKSPLARIKVAVMGPVVNIVFAFILFTVIWLCGGKQEPFARHTNIIGYVDPHSELYNKGVRAGDQITQYNNQEFHGFKDLIYASILKQKNLDIEGYKINYFDQSQESFRYLLKPYLDPRSKNQDIQTIGVMTPASFLMFLQGQGGLDFPFDESPMHHSGIAYGDRIVWANGELVFSLQQLTTIVNEPKTLLTVQRGEQRLLVKVPRLKISDLRLNKYQKSEFEDWRHQIQSKKTVKELMFIPYMTDLHGFVQSSVSFIGEDSEEHTVYDGEEPVLKTGDHIVAVDGESISQEYTLLDALQQKHVKLIVQRGFDPKNLTWKNENERFVHAINSKNLTAAVAAIRDAKAQENFGDLHVLKTVTPVLLSDLPFSSTKKNWFSEEVNLQQARIDKIKDPVLRAQATKLLDKSKQKLVLGLPFADMAVKFNPNPFALFSQVVGETFKTLSSLFTGKLNPKWMSGPIGMVQIIHHGWTVGIQEALFWMAAISLNLGVFNLLPLPVLDGGHICFSCYEWITRKRLKAKTMEKMIIPFVVVLVALFLYVTYQDVVRLIGRFF